MPHSIFYILFIKIMKNYGLCSLQLKRDGDGIMELSSKVRSRSWRTLSLEYQQR